MMSEDSNPGRWELQRMEGKNPIHTGGFLTAYDQREFTADEVAARESGQNAIDAGRKVPGITELHFHRLTVKGAAKTKFMDLLQLEPVLRPRLETFEKDEANKRFAGKLRDLLDGKSIAALLIRDLNTCGLGGQWDRYERGDHFARLVCALNLDDKADGDSESGGSFGLGKTTYAKSSLVNTVIYHSVFEQTPETRGVHRRLMATGVYPRHQHDGVQFGGFAYFGAPVDDESDETRPFENEEAKALWQELMTLCGLSVVREEGDSGTDILILMDRLDLDSLKTAVEDYYFPALNNNQLNVTFHSEDGSSFSPAPLARKDLDQFVRLFRTAEEHAGKQKPQDGFLSKPLNKISGTNLGTFAFERAEQDEAVSGKRNCVAVARGTGMIINYEKLGSDRFEPAVGAFVAHSDAYPYLVASENAAHSEWNEEQRRLEEKYQDEGRKVVKAINGRLKDNFEAFQRSLQPDVTQSRTESGQLAKLLSGALSGSKGDLAPRKDFHNPVSIHLTKRKREDARSIWRLLLQENEHTPDVCFQLKVKPSISVAGERLVPLRHREIIVKDAEGNVLVQKDAPELEFEFSRGQEVDLTIEAPNPGRLNYVVQCKCVADIPGPENE